MRRCGSLAVLSLSTACSFVHFACVGLPCASLIVSRVRHPSRLTRQQWGHPGNKGLATWPPLWLTAKLKTLCLCRVIPTIRGRSEMFFEGLTYADLCGGRGGTGTCCLMRRSRLWCWCGLCLRQRVACVLRAADRIPCSFCSAGNVVCI